MFCSAVATAAAILERLVNEQLKLKHVIDDGKEHEDMVAQSKSTRSPHRGRPCKLKVLTPRTTAVTWRSMTLSSYSV